MIWRGKRIILCIHLEIATNREWLCKSSLHSKTHLTMSFTIKLNYSKQDKVMLDARNTTLLMKPVKTIFMKQMSNPRSRIWQDWYVALAFLSLWNWLIHIDEKPDAPHLNKLAAFESTAENPLLSVELKRDFQKTPYVLKCHCDEIFRSHCFCIFWIFKWYLLTCPSRFVQQAREDGFFYGFFRKFFVRHY